MSTAGAESEPTRNGQWREAAARRRRTTWRVSGLLALAATVGCAYGVASSPWLRIERVTIRCPDPDVAQEAAAAARIAPDATLVTVPAWRLRRDIGSCPRVKRATVQRRWQHALDIIVVPRQPAVALVAQSDCVLADEDGVCIRRVPERPAHLPVVRGPVVADIAPGDIVSRARMATAWECLQWTERLPVLGTVSVDISVPQRICVYADDGTKGIIGRPTDLGRKLACFAAALQHLRVRGLRARYVDVQDVRVGALLRLAPGSPAPPSGEA